MVAYSSSLLKASPPTGFISHALPCGASWLRAQWVDQLTKAVGQATAPVIALALASKDSQRFRGRAAVATWNCAELSAPLVVRRCSHGGFWRHLAGDRYVGEQRARIEIEHSQRIHAQGIATPEIVGVVLYKQVLFARMDFLTVQVPNSVDLVAFLASQPTAQQRTAVIQAVRDLLAQCALHGLLHKDLNARNILLVHTNNSARAYLLDVEDVVWAPEKAEQVRAANHARLARSLRKRVRKGDLAMAPQQLLALISELEFHA